MSHAHTMLYLAAYKAGFIGRLWSSNGEYKLAPVNAAGGLTGDGAASAISIKDLITSIERCYPTVDTSICRKPPNAETVHSTWRELIRRA